MLFELATLGCHLLAVDRAAAAAQAWMQDGAAKGELLGAWRTELGTLGRVLILRGFETPEDMSAERHRALLSANPFNAGSIVTELTTDSYAPFPFLPPVRTGERGPVYEFRTYRQKPGGLPATLAGWQAALAPARDYTQHLVTNLYALDGPPRITHIWAFASLEQRQTLRRQAYDAGVWPPHGGPDQIAEATATIALSLSHSPLH